jgi:hypothetical protein
MAFPLLCWCYKCRKRNVAGGRPSRYGKRGSKSSYPRLVELTDAALVDLLQGVFLGDSFYKLARGDHFCNGVDVIDNQWHIRHLLHD